jgi:hypothetical protein
VLDLLLADAGARDGELYLSGAHGLSVVAATREGLSTKETAAMLARLADGAREEADTMLQTCTLALEGPPGAGGAASSVWPIVLICARAGENVVAGIAALHFDANAAVRLPFELASAAAAALFDCGDVDSPQTSSEALTKSSR